jgi:putative transposase
MAHNCKRRPQSDSGTAPWTIAEFVEHYHGERNHQGLGNELIDGARAVERVGRIRRRQRLGGLLNYYARAA